MPVPILHSPPGAGGLHTLRDNMYKADAPVRPWTQLDWGPHHSWHRDYLQDPTKTLQSHVHEWALRGMSTHSDVSSHDTSSLYYLGKLGLAPRAPKANRQRPCLYDLQ